MLTRELIQWARELLIRSRESKLRRADRLRQLYLDVLTAAIQATPAALQYRPAGGPPILAAQDADRMRARLMLERLEDGDEILKAFVGVVNWSSMYMGDLESEAAHPGRVPTSELRKTEQLIRDNVTKIEEKARKRLHDLAD